MLAEAARYPLANSERQNRATKRRRLEEGSSTLTDSELVTGDDAPPSPASGTVTTNESEITQPNLRKQTVLDDFGVSDGDSDEDFEDVDLGAEADVNHQEEWSDEPLHLDLSQKPGREIESLARRRKPATAAEKRTRLDVHKWHILCLLAHLQRRSHWCNDGQVQSTLKPLIARKLVKLLHVDASQPQYQRTHSFNTAIDEISKMWRSEWKVTEEGMRRAYWKEEPDDLQNIDEISDPIDFADFREAAKSRSGSRDLGAQLFCSLLRAVAVDTRLVCSLQPLPFSGVAKSMTPEKPKPQYIMASSLGRQPQWGQNSVSSMSSSPGWRLYGVENDGSTPNAPKKKLSKRARDSPYPIFWVEVFTEALQKWIPVDPLVRYTINKPKTGFEPAAKDPLNNLSYVVAFEDDGSAKDITRRYAQFFNGKTRRSRVESTKGGERWWKKTMSFFEKAFGEDRDDIEDAELLAREESEQMPRNVQDFKNHPLYALERHLRRNEVIYPKREVGKVRVGPSKDGKLEPVFRRRDALVVRTADQWYRLGRDVKIGEQPLKRVVLQKRREETVESEDEGQQEGARLYGEFQTDLYVPPVVVSGKIPKNAYGNLDVYVPSMIPAGGIHVQHPDAAKAAKILGISYADAVTGFEFKGRQGTAVLNGIVAAAEFRDALVEVVEAIGVERARENSEKRSSIAVQMWRKFLTALRVRERVHTRYGERGSEAGSDDDEMEDNTYHDEDEVDEDEFDDEGGGGFFPEQNEGPASLAQASETAPVKDAGIFSPESPVEVAIPIMIRESPHKVPDQQEPPGRADQPWQGSNLVGNHQNFTGAGSGGFLIDDPTPNLQASSLGMPARQPTPSIINTAVTSGTDITANSFPDRHCTTTSTTTTTTSIPLAKTTPCTKTDPFSPAQQDQPQHDTDPPQTTKTQQHPPDHAPPNPSQPNPDPTEAEKDQSQDQDQDQDSDFLEKGSLLSHDPEDEDAEPDWLAEAMDSD
jgi:xeroderma pigmentosum group C-complementing protein